MFKILDDKLPGLSVAFAVAVLIAQFTLKADDVQEPELVSMNFCVLGECWQ